MSADLPSMLRQAADQLDKLHAAATQGPWVAFGGVVAAPVEGCTCGSPGWPDSHEPGCGLTPLLDAGPENAPLIAAMRGAAAPLAAWLRHQATYAEASGSECLNGHGKHARAVTRAILGGHE